MSAARLKMKPFEYIAIFTVKQEISDESFLAMGYSGISIMASEESVACVQRVIDNSNHLLKIKLCFMRCKDRVCTEWVDIYKILFNRGQTVFPLRFENAWQMPEAGWNCLDALETTQGCINKEIFGQRLSAAIQRKVTGKTLFSYLDTIQKSLADVPEKAHEDIEPPRAVVEDTEKKSAAASYPYKRYGGIVFFGANVGGLSAYAAGAPAITLAGLTIPGVVIGILAGAIVTCLLLTIYSCYCSRNSGNAPSFSACLAR
ncbi:MAG: hypothetical protein K0S27_1132 [Gammaproteobacteria bacterium]|nr:hypothetical protein [Gammaproteobacteria bacterium]